MSQVQVFQSQARFSGDINPFLGISSDLTAITTAWAAPCNGSCIPVQDPTSASAWYYLDMGAGLSIGLTKVSNGCALTNGSANVTGGDNSMYDVVPGMEVTGTGIPASTTVSSVTGAFAFTMNNNATSTTSSNLTFKLPAGKNYDVFAVTNSQKSLQLVFSPPWTNDTTRASAVSLSSGVMTNSAQFTSGWNLGTSSNVVAASAGTLIGTLRTTATAGQTEDSKLRRYISSYCNRIPKKLLVTDTTASWTYTTATWRQVRAQTANRVEVVCCDASIMASIRAVALAVSSVGGLNVATGVGVDSTTVNSAECTGGGIGAIQPAQIIGHYENAPGVGYHAINWLEISQASATTTWIGTSAGLSAVQSGMTGRIDC